MNKTIAIIPARGGSKRLPKKNILTLGEIPLMAHSILYAKKHNFIEEVYVSTDDAAIKKVALNYLTTSFRPLMNPKYVLLHCALTQQLCNLN